MISLESTPQQLGKALFLIIDALEIEDCFIVIPSITLSDEQLLEYWGALEYHDTLKYRFVDMHEPTAREIVELAKQYTRAGSKTKMYSIVDCDSHKMIGEFTLDRYNGISAETHISMHPNNGSKLNLYLGDEVSTMVLNNWSATLEMDKPFLVTSYGITPSKNRVVCMFIRKIGYTIVGTIPDAENFLGGTSDVMVSFKTRH